MDNRVKQETADEMRRLKASGLNYAQIAKEVKCLESTVICCLTGKKRKSYPSDFKKKNTVDENIFDHKKNKLF